MMNKKILDNEKIINSCQLPKDVVLGASIISMTGNGELEIENFKNIIKFLPEIILIQCKHYQISIVGSGLYIEYYSKEELKIKGHIKEIKFHSGSKI